MNPMMDRLQPVRFYIAIVGFFVAAMVGATFFFLVEMDNATYFVTDGVNVGVHYLDKPGFDGGLQGFIFAVTFLLAGGLLVLLIMLPNGRPVGRRYMAPMESPQPAAAMPSRAGARYHDDYEGMEEDVVLGPPAEAMGVPHAEESHAKSSPLVIATDEDGMESREAPMAAPSIPDVSDKEFSDLPDFEAPGYRSDETGEDDVVYGNGRVTDDSAWEFVQTYPDSAVKFLYRKNLDNKALSPGDEEVYREWEMRGLTRAKVREIVLEIMRWDSLPEDFPHNIWRELRDQIYEMRIHQH